VNAADRAAILDGIELHDQLRAAVDARTLEIVEHRRRTSVIKRRGWLVRRLLLTADLVGLVAALALAEWLVNRHNSMGVLGTREEVIAFVLSLPAWVVIAKLYGLYDRDEERTDHSTAGDFAGVFHMVTVCTFLFWAFAYITGVAHPTPPKLLIFWICAIGFISAGRAIARSLARKNIAYLQNTIIVGAGDVGQLVARKVLQHPEYGLNLVGFVDADPKAVREEVEHLALLGAPDRLPALIRAFDIERVIIAFSRDPNDETVELIRRLRDLNVQIDVVPRLFEVVGPTFGIHTVEGLPLIGLPPARISRSSRLIKRAIDLVVASLLLALTWPVFVYAAWRIKRDSPGPVFFRQRRLGMDMREFTALKFRTMRVDTDDGPHREFIKQTMSHSATVNENGIYKLDRDDAVTPFGRWLRRTSIDELPQLINVIRGDMSLVGPRPCIPYETESFKPYHFDRFLVPAGLTGLWQVTARAHSTFGEALDLDVAYAHGWSLRLDLALLFKTPGQVVRARGTA
jgi:exopolysaccharide biosynthesis polyprenyl glycosylphosphotransferase